MGSNHQFFGWAQGTNLLGGLEPPTFLVGSNHQLFGWAQTTNFSGGLEPPTFWWAWTTNLLVCSNHQPFGWARTTNIQVHFLSFLCISVLNSRYNDLLITLVTVINTMVKVANTVREIQSPVRAHTLQSTGQLCSPASPWRIGGSRSREQGWGAGGRTGGRCGSINVLITV